MSESRFTAGARPRDVHLSADLALSPCEEGSQRRFTMLAYTGAVVERLWGKAAFALGGIELPPNGRVPILLNHNEDSIVGQADTARFTDRGLELSGFLSNATEHGRMVQALCDEGYTFQASLGLRPTEWTEVKEGENLSVNGQVVSGPVSVATKSRLLESSFVNAGADKNTHAVALTVHLSPDEEPPVADLTPEIEALKAEIEALKEKVKETETLRTLEAEARHPGVGFRAPETSEKQSKPQTLKDLWERDEALQAEFFGDPDACASYFLRNTEELQALLEAAK